MEPHGLKPVVPGLPRLVRYGKILFDNFAILAGVIRRHAVGAESTEAPRLFAAFIHGLKSRGILRRRIKIRPMMVCGIRIYYNTLHKTANKNHKNVSVPITD